MPRTSKIAADKTLETAAKIAAADPEAAKPKKDAKVFKFPKAPGAWADRLFTLREERSQAQKVVDGIEAEEKALKEHIINNLGKSEASGVSGKLARVTVVTKQVPSVKDWPAFYAYIKKTGSWELLQRRVSEGAVKERWDAKKTVPGVEAFGAVTVSLNKL